MKCKDRILGLNQYIYEFIAFFAAFIPRMILIFGIWPLRTVTDEMITISGGAYLAGLDWSNLLSYSERYYGSGFTMLFVWIFKLTDNPVIIYRVYLMGCVLAQAAVALICFNIMHKGLEINNKKFVCVASIACSYCVVTRATIVYNEHILILISWIIAWSLIYLVKQNISKKRKNILSVILVLIMLYSLTVHARAYTYWIAAVGVIVLYLWTYRKLLIPIWAMGLSVVTALGVNYLVNLLKQHMYLIQPGESLTNTKITLNGAYYLKSIYSWEGWLNIILGQINTISIFTGGLIAIGVVLGFVLLWKKLLRKNALTQLKDNSAVETQYWVILCFFGAAILMTIIAQSFSWLGDVYNEMTGTIQEGGYSYKAFTYVRYFGPYCGPVLMIVFAFLYQYKKEAAGFIKKAAVFLGIIQVYWIAVILPHIYNNRYAVEVFLPFSLSKFEDIPRIRTYLAGTIVMIIFFLIVWLLYRFKKTIVIASLVSVFLIFQYVYNAVDFDGAYSVNENYADCYDAYQFIKNLESKTELPEEIYVIEGRNIQNQQIFYEYQFLLNNYKIIPEYPSADINEAIVISNIELVDLEGYEIFKFADNSYVYIKGSRLLSRK